MTLKLNGASSGHVTLDAKASAASNTLTLPSTANGELVAADSSGNITISNGNLIVGTAGKGIDFSTTADATGKTSELLDDYEEGDWTPAVSSGGWGIGTDYSSTYTKIGNVVTLNCYIVLSGSGDGNSFQMSGFPFSVANNKYSAAVVDFGKGGYKGAYIRPNLGTDANFLQSSENPSNNRYSILGNQIGASYIIFTVSYMTS